MVLSAPAPVLRTAEQLLWGQAGQPEALAAQVRLIGVPDLDRKVRYTRAVGRGLSQREVALPS